MVIAVSVTKMTPDGKTDNHIGHIVIDGIQVYSMYSIQFNLLLSVYVVQAYHRFGNSPLPT
jgi:hypothetical protein